MRVVVGVAPGGATDIQVRLFAQKLGADLDSLLAEGAEPVGSTSEQFAQGIQSELARWRRVVKDANLKAD